MRMAIAISVLFFLPCSAVQAAFTDFGDYTENVTFEADEIFQSGGLSFKAFGEQSIGGRVLISASDNFASLLVGAGVEFLLPVGTQEVSFDYVNGAGRRVLVNGIEPVSPLDASFSFLDGRTVNGVSYSVIVDVQSSKPSGVTSERGTLTLQGPLNALTLEGLELSIDNVTVNG